MISGFPDFVELSTRLPYKVSNLYNDYSACAFVAVIRAFASMGPWFIRALRRRVSNVGKPPQERASQDEKNVCTWLLDAIDKGEGDRYKKTVTAPKRMKTFRGLISKLGWADCEFKENVGLSPPDVIDAFVSLLHRDDQQHLKLVNLKAFKCNSRDRDNHLCNAVSNTPFIVPVSPVHRIPRRPKS